MSYELHPLCTLFPRLADAEFASLVADIRANGLREPITLHGGMVLDGGNRYRACLAAGIEPVFTEYQGESIVAYVLSANLHRRHLTAPQQAAIVASAQDWAAAQSHGGARSSVPENTCTTTAQRAAQSGASISTQRRADAVAKADPDLAKRVAHGEVSLPRAVEQVAPHLAAKKPAPAEQIERPASEPGCNPITPPALDSEQLGDPDEYAPDDAEIADALAAEAETLALFRKAMEGDDPLSVALRENTRLQAENDGLRSRLDGLMNEKNEAVRLAKSLRRKLEAIEKAQA